MANRACDGCTACCHLLAVAELQKPCFQTCQHQQEAGCAIYESRPASCADFACIWHQAEAPGFTDDPSDRPSNLGVAFFLFAKSPVPGRPCVVAYELRQDAALQPRVRELIEAMGKLRPVAIIEFGTHAQIIRYPDDMRAAMRTGSTTAVDRYE